MGFNLNRNIQFLICASTLSFSNQKIEASNLGIDHTDTRHHFNISVNLCTNSNAYYDCVLLRFFRKIVSPSIRLYLTFCFKA